MEVRWVSRNRQWSLLTRDGEDGGDVARRFEDEEGVELGSQFMGKMVFMPL